MGGQPLGDFDLAPFSQQWEQLRLLARQMEAADSSRDHGFTARKFDEQKPAGPRTYIIAANHIGRGLEHVDAIEHLFTTPFGATVWAPWTLLRSVFEAGFWSTYILESDDSIVRRQRGLNAAVRDSVEYNLFLDDFLAHDPKARDEAREDPKTNQTYHAEAEALGLTWPQARNKLNVVDSLKKLEVVKAMEPAVHDATLAMWRSLSGMQHGHAYAVLVGTEVHAARPIAGGEVQTLVFREDSFLVAATAANRLLMTGMQYYIERSTRT